MFSLSSLGSVAPPTASSFSVPSENRKRKTREETTTEEVRVCGSRLWTGFVLVSCCGECPQLVPFLEKVAGVGG